MRRLVFLTLAALPFTLLAGCEDNNKNKARTSDKWFPPPEIGQEAPEISGVDLDGVYFSLRDKEYKGKVIMLDFFGTWCGPCMASMPHNQDLVKKFAGRPFALLGVDCDTDYDKKKAAQVTGFRCWADGGGYGNPPGPIVKRWGISGFPTVVLIDHEGIIRKIYPGPPGHELDVAIERLVRKAENK